MRTTSKVGKTYDYGDRYSDPNRGSDQRRNGSKNSYQVAEMQERHHEIANLLLLGVSGVDIAERLGISEVTVSYVKNSPVVKDKLTLQRAARDVGCIDLAREIKDLAPIALDRVKEALEEGKVHGKELSASGILKEANTILDREIGKPTQTINTRNAHAHFTLEDLEDIKNRAVRLAGENGVMGT